MTNNDYFPWDEIPDSNVFPTLTGRFEFSKLEDGESSTGKRMFRGVFTCIEPAQYAGMAHFENFVTGNDENPKGIVAGTMGSRALKSAIAKAQVPQAASIAQICQVVTTSKPQLMLSIVHQIEQGGDYAGQERNKITAYHKIGEREVQIAPRPGVMGSAPAGPAVAPSMPAAAASPQPAQAPAAPVAQQPAAAPAPVAPVQPAPPAAAAPAAPQPAPTATPATPAAAQAAPATGGMTVPCQICAQKGNPNNLILMDQFQEHVGRHQTDPNWNGVG